MISYDNEIIGVFAFNDKTADVFCNEEACIIAGSKGKIKKYIREAPGIDPNSVPRIKKTTFGEIKQGMTMGGIYDFDEEAFERFKQIAAKDGLTFKDFGQDKRNDGRGIKLFRIAFIGKDVEGGREQKRRSFAGKIFSFFCRRKA